jgi:hypothetical protein
MSLHFIMGTGDKDRTALMSQMKNKLRQLLQSTALFRQILNLTRTQYRPEKYYMRGPGPKAEAKARAAFAMDRRVAGGAKPPAKQARP